MNTITITVEMTPENLEVLKQLCPQPVEKPAEKKTRKKKTEAPVEAAPAPVEEAPAEAPEPVKTYTAIDVKAVCLKLSKAGKQDLLRAAFAKFGGKKLSDIKPEDYPALMDELTTGGAENA